MQHKDNGTLLELWNTELSRMNPESKVEMPDISGDFFSEIGRLINRAFDVFSSLPQIKSAGGILFYGLSALIFLLLLRILWKRYGSAVKSGLRRIFGRSDVKSVNDYISLVDAGKYSEAIRMIVGLISQLYRRKSRTFRELFASAPWENSRSAQVYGKIIHTSYSAGLKELTEIKEMADGMYPEIKKRKTE